MSNPMQHSRRRLLAATLSMLGASIVGPFKPALAAHRVPTPPQSRGPFYPDRIPLDSDNDLVTVKGRPAPAKGEITSVVGRCLDEKERPLRNAHIEIWQCDAFGRYHHPWDRRDAPLDANFQGYGRFVTRDDGAYRFRTIKPVPYPGRAPHIHFAIRGPSFEPLVTQMYVKGAPENDRDGILNSIPDARGRRSVMVAFEPRADAPGELIARFDIILSGDGRYAKG